MRILGIDPGSHRCGYSVVDMAANQPKLITHGCFDYPPKSKATDRLVRLEQDILNVCQEYKPGLMAIESLFFSKNVSTAMQVSEARGVLLLVAGKESIPVQDCTPMQVKMAMTGYGRADKNQIKHMVQLQFRGTDLHKLDDAVDAIAVALTGSSLFAVDQQVNRGKLI